MTWTDAKVKQGTGRTERLGGRAKRVYSVVFVAKNTLDEYKRALALGKGDRNRTWVQGVALPGGNDSLISRSMLDEFYKLFCRTKEDGKEEEEAEAEREVESSSRKRKKSENDDDEEDDSLVLVNKYREAMANPERPQLGATVDLRFAEARKIRFAFSFHDDGGMDYKVDSQKGGKKETSEVDAAQRKRKREEDKEAKKQAKLEEKLKKQAEKEKEKKENKQNKKQKKDHGKDLFTSLNKLIESRNKERKEEEEEELMQDSSSSSEEQHEQKKQKKASPGEQVQDPEVQKLLDLVRSGHFEQVALMAQSLASTKTIKTTQSIMSGEGQPTATTTQPNSVVLADEEPQDPQLPQEGRQSSDQDEEMPDLEAIDFGHDQLIDFGLDHHLEGEEDYFESGDEGEDSMMYF